MSKLEKDSEKITAYIFNNMESDERLAFEEDLKIDVDLASEYRFQLKVQGFLKQESGEKPDSENGDSEGEQTFVEIADDSGADIDELAAEHAIHTHEKKYPDDFEVTDQDRAEFRELLRDVDHIVDESSNEESGASISLRKWLYALTAAAAIIIAIWTINSSPWINSSEKLFSKYYQPLTEVNFVERNGDVVGLEDFQKGVQFYRNEEFAAASKIFLELAEHDPKFEDAVFFLGLSLMGEELFNEAVNQLEFYLTRYTFFESEASWYLALCYLKLEDFDMSIQQLQGLTSSPRRIGRDADELLKRLSKLSGD